MALPVITIPAFAGSTDGVRHFFGTRQHAALFGSYPISSAAKILNGQGAAVWGGRLSPRAGPPVLVSVKQVHGADALVLDHPLTEDHTISGEWDAIVTNQAGVLVTVRTADCVPVLVHDPVKRVVAAIHAGWRGAVARIVPKTLAVMQSRFGTLASSVQIGIGPSVGPCCYEVDGPVIRKLQEGFADWQSVVTDSRQEKMFLDLRELVRRQALSVGVTDDRISSVRACTVCHPDLFFSYRREGVVKGTMVSGIGLLR